MKPVYAMLRRVPQKETASLIKIRKRVLTLLFGGVLDTG
jgi:hypothetical protein